jgi:hypothetical protein
MMNSFGRIGIICPPGIASEETNKDFFSDLIEKNAIVSLIAFVNEKFIFPAVLHNFRFCLLTLASPKWKIEQGHFAFECQTLEDTKQALRYFTLSKADVGLFSPNTLTAPVFRTKIDAILTRKIYEHIPVFVNEKSALNPWHVDYMTMLHMSNDSGLFVTKPDSNYVPLVEGKMIHQYDHRFGSFESIQGQRTHMLPKTPIDKYKDPGYFVKPFYWIPQSEVEARLKNKWDKKWLLIFRDVTSKSLERTAIFAILPRIGYSDPFLVFSATELGTNLLACLLANFNSLVFDFVARQKVGGTHLKKYMIYQLPVLPPTAYTTANVEFIVIRVLELVYTAYDLKPYAYDLGFEGEPFQWNEGRRALLRAELDAYYAHLYGLTREELRYILDPQDVYGEDFPGETFRVLKDREIRNYGEYRTRRLVLEAWDKLFGKGGA